jgi:capsular exopolysaccharide synthesis family protein
LSKNYELLQMSHRCQRLFGAILQEFASAADHAARTHQRTHGATLPREETGRRSKQIASSWERALSQLLKRGKATLRSVMDGVRSLRLARSHPKPRFTPELASIAREEQMKLMQRVFLNGKQGPRVVVFCGIEGGNGCSRVCAESAAALAAQTSGTVCLVDADLRSPTLHRLFGLNNGKGFAEAMLRCGPIREYSHQLGNLWIMTSGAHTSDPHMLLASETLRPRMKELREAFDFVLIDAPPLNPFADATKLSRLADGIVLVMEANSTRREAARKAKEDLNAADSRILAAVLNRRTYPIPEALYRRL